MQSPCSILLQKTVIKKPWRPEPPRTEYFTCHVCLHECQFTPSSTSTSLAKPCLIKSWHRGSPEHYHMTAGPPFKAMSHEGHVNHHVKAKGLEGYVKYTDIAMLEGCSRGPSTSRASNRNTWPCVRKTTCSGLLLSHKCPPTKGA